MSILHHFVIFWALAFSILAASNPALCLKGCCGLQLELPSSHLSFSNPSAKEAHAVISLEHSDSGIKCCPCEESIGSPADVQSTPEGTSVLENINAAMGVSQPP